LLQRDVACAEPVGVYRGLAAVLAWQRFERVSPLRLL
jgi:hypothetical protein